MASSRSETDFDENHYYRINEIFLSTLKFWPYRRTKFKSIYHAFHYVIMLSHIFFQLTSFLTSQLTVTLLVSVFSYVITIFICVVQYYSFCSKPDEITRIWRNVHECWSTLKNEIERDIMRRYSSVGELYTIIISVIIVVTFTIYSFILLSPAILDAIFPLNETRPRQLHVPTHYFVNQKTYYYPIVCHWLLCAYLGGFIATTINTALMVYIEHICGLLKIASYRIQHSIDIYRLPNPVQKKDRIAFQNISSAVDIHRKALEYSEVLEASFESNFFILVVTSVICLSLNLFRFLQAITSLNINELISSTGIIALLFLFMFLANYFGQMVTDHNHEMFSNTYDTQWYMAPIKIQKLLLFIMTKTTKPYVFHIGLIIMGSLENFAKIMSASMSYFTLMYSFL